MNKNTKKLLFNIGKFMLVSSGLAIIGCALLPSSIHVPMDIVMHLLLIAIIGIGISILNSDTEPYQYGCKDCDFNTNDFIEAHHHAADNNHKTFHRMFQK